MVSRSLTAPAPSVLFSPSDAAGTKNRTNREGWTISAQIVEVEVLEEEEATREDEITGKWRSRGVPIHFRPGKTEPCPDSADRVE